MNLSAIIQVFEISDKLELLLLYYFQNEFALRFLLSCARTPTLGI